MSRYCIQRRDGSIDGLGTPESLEFDSEEQAWEAAQVAFGKDPASQAYGIRSWLKVVEFEDDPNILSVPTWGFGHWDIG
jgi:hypothetical protein